MVVVMSVSVVVRVVAAAAGGAGVEGGHGWLPGRECGMVMLASLACMGRAGR